MHLYSNVRKNLGLWLVSADLVNCPSKIPRWFLCVWLLIELSVFSQSVMVFYWVKVSVFYCVMDLACMKLSMLGQCLYECRVSCWRGSVPLETGTAVDPSLKNQILVTDYRHIHSSINKNVCN